MSARNFDEALRRVLREEGGYTNHPQDPGGPTNYGITLADARRYWKPNATAADVKAMPVEVAKGIYRHKYWDVMRCDELPDGVDYCVFDYGVNSGAGRAPKVLRRVLGLPDSAPFEKVALAVAGRNRIAIDAICDERLRFLNSLETWPVFGRGWAARVARVRTAALAMLRQGTDEDSARLSPEADQPQSPSSTFARTATIGGAVVGGGLLAGKAGVSPGVIAVVLIAAVCLGVGVYLFVRRARRRSHV